MKYELFNQFGHPIEVDLPLEIQSIENWTEHYYFWCYDPATEYGIYIHMGRLLPDSTIWRPVVQIFLPGQQSLCTTIHGRGEDGIGPGAAPLKLNCIEPHRSWSIHFDGVGARASRNELMNGAIDDRPVEPIRFSLLFDGAAPNFGKHIWGDGGVATFHTEQICKVRGHIAHEGRIIHFDGVGARDHSAGPRDYAPVVGDIWFQCLFEDGDAIMVQVVHFEKLNIKASYYYPAGSDAIEDLEILEHPTVAATDSPPGLLARDPLADKESEFVIRLARANGEEIKLECTLLTACAVTLKSPLEEYHGTGTGAGLQMCECAARVKWGDKIGYANRERSTRLASLGPPASQR